MHSPGAGGEDSSGDGDGHVSTAGSHSGEELGEADWLGQGSALEAGVVLGLHSKTQLSMDAPAPVQVSKQFPSIL